MGLGAGPAHAVYFSVYEYCKKRFSRCSAVSGLWNTVTGGNSGREALIAIRCGMQLFREVDVLGSVVEFDKAIELDPRQKASDPVREQLIKLKAGDCRFIMRQIILVLPTQGSGRPYALFAGRNATRASTLMSFDAQDLTVNIDGLNSSKFEVLQGWEYKFIEKYVKVGQIVSEKSKNVPDKSFDKNE